MSADDQLPSNAPSDRTPSRGRRKRNNARKDAARAYRAQHGGTWREAMRAVSPNTTPTRTYPPFDIGLDVIFAGDPHPWTVRAVSRSGRFVCCTRPDDTGHDLGEQLRGIWLGRASERAQDAAQQWSARADDLRTALDQLHTSLDLPPEPPELIYTVLDLETGRRGPDNFHGITDYRTDEDCREALECFEATAVYNDLHDQGLTPAAHYSDDASWAPPHLHSVLIAENGHARPHAELSRRQDTTIGMPLRMQGSPRAAEIAAAVTAFLDRLRPGAAAHRR